MRPSVVVKIPKSIEMGLGIPQILVQLTLYASLPDRLIDPCLLALCLRMFNPSMNFMCYKVVQLNLSSHAHHKSNECSD